MTARDILTIKDFSISFNRIIKKAAKISRLPENNLNKAMTTTVRSIIENIFFLQHVLLYVYA